jgi:hypothetical protein
MATAATIKINKMIGELPKMRGLRLSGMIVSLALRIDPIGAKHHGPEPFPPAPTGSLQSLRRLAYGPGIVGQGRASNNLA